MGKLLRLPELFTRHNVTAKRKGCIAGWHSLEASRTENSGAPCQIDGLKRSNVSVSGIIYSIEQDPHTHQKSHRNFC